MELEDKEYTNASRSIRKSTCIFFWNETKSKLVNFRIKTILVDMSSIFRSDHQAGIRVKLLRMSLKNSTAGPLQTWTPQIRLALDVFKRFVMNIKLIIRNNFN